MYKFDSVKEISPTETLLKLYKICKKLGLYKNNRLKFFSIKFFYGSYVANIRADFSDLLGNKGNIVSSGKGYTYEQCMCSVYMEFIERLVHRKKRNFNFINYDTGEMIKLIKKEQILIKNSSNGLSAGNSFNEALVGGIYEVLERYAQKCFLDRTNNIYIKLINIETIGKFYKKEGEILNNMLKNKNIVLNKLYEIVFIGTKIYTYLCYSEAKNGVCFLGAGMHHSQKIALLRAITENIQVSTGVSLTSNFGKFGKKEAFLCPDCVYSDYVIRKAKHKFRNFENNEEKLVKF